MFVHACQVLEESLADRASRPFIHWLAFFHPSFPTRVPLRVVFRTPHKFIVAFARTRMCRLQMLPESVFSLESEHTNGARKDVRVADRFGANLFVFLPVIAPEELFLTTRAFVVESNAVRLGLVSDTRAPARKLFAAASAFKS